MRIRIQIYIHDLRASPYTFTAEVGAIDDRFILRYTNETLSIDEAIGDNTFIFIRNAELNVKSSKEISRVVVYDLTGKRILNNFVNTGNRAYVTAFNFSKSAYLVSIVFADRTVLNKKVIN